MMMKMIKGNMGGSHRCFVLIVARAMVGRSNYVIIHLDPAER
jgi:hypothetical protein